MGPTQFFVHAAWLPINPMDSPSSEDWLQGKEDIQQPEKSTLVRETMECLAAESWSSGMRRIAYDASTCIFALVGAVIGAVAGAIAGQATETGLLRGMGIGAIGGSVTFIDALDSLCTGEASLSKTAIFTILTEGIIKIYHFQIYNTQNWDLVTNYHEITSNNNEGMTWDSVAKLPEFSFDSSKLNACGDVNCAVCLQGFEEGERARRLPICCHVFHSGCIDTWLTRQATCPICRINVN